MEVTLAILRRFLLDRTGLALDASKDYLLETRLAPVVEALGFTSLEDLARAVATRPHLGLTRAVVDAMMTNETFFFRDRFPFERFRTVTLPRLLVSRADERRIRIWCAACSTGQEPYSLAMVLDEEVRKLAGWTVEIVATDISSSAIETARRGHYSHFEAQRGLPASQLMRNFERVGEDWVVREHLRERIRFREFNLLDDFGVLGTFDLVFCRNVLIYFSPSAKASLMARMALALRSDGVLTLGSTETVVGLTTEFVADPIAAGHFLRRGASENDQKRLRLVV